MQLIYWDHINDDAKNNFYAADEIKYIRLMNIIWVAVASCFFVIEWMQIYILGGFREYWAASRWFEFLWCPTQVLYFYLKIKFTDESYPLIDYVDSALLADK